MRYHIYTAVVPTNSLFASAKAQEEGPLRERIRIEVANMLACWSRYGLDEESVDSAPDQPLIQAVAERGTPNLRILQSSSAMEELAAAFRIEGSPEAIVGRYKIYYNIVSICSRPTKCNNRVFNNSGI